MSDPIEVARFQLAGEPKPKRRARIGSRGGWTPEETRNHEVKIGWAFQQQNHGHTVSSTDRFRVMLLFACHKRYRTDVDNLAKLVMDALNGLAWKDDWQVDELSIRRVWAAEPEHARTNCIILKTQGGDADA